MESNERDDRKEEKGAEEGKGRESENGKGLKERGMG